VFGKDNEKRNLFIAFYKYAVLECRGCEAITFCEFYAGEDDPDGSTTHYPPRISRPKPEWLHTWDLVVGHDDLYTLFLEVYNSLYANSSRLAMTGAGAIIEVICLDKLGDIGGFEEKLGELEKRGLISSQDHEILQAAVEAGHAAIHRGHKPSIEDVKRVMNIVEHLTQSLYVLGDTAESLKQRTPPRKRAS
jgi:hypothetical protein